MAEVSARPTAREIYERVLDDARAELDRTNAQLGFSGLFAGGTIGFSAVGVALIAAALADATGAHVIASLAYPIGFIAVILGRAQLFTENTLYPVALIFEERRHLAATARLWCVVFAANIAGAITFAAFLALSGALPADAMDELVAIGGALSDGGFAESFWPAVIGGWLLALVAWLVEASETAIGQIVVVYAVTFIVGVGLFDHSIASAVEVFAAFFEGEFGFGRTIGWLATATLGNAIGGVAIVTLLNYAQVMHDHER